MGKREKYQKEAKSHHEEENEEEECRETPKPANFSFAPSSSDDEEANEDLSLKIVEKAMLRMSSAGEGDAVSIEAKGSEGDAAANEIGLCLSPLQEAEVVTYAKGVQKSRHVKKSKKSKKIETTEGTVVVAKEEGKAAENDVESAKLVETSPGETSNNIVLRKLLRGPRYFDPPDSGWGTCYNCGEEGHRSVNCTSAKRKKPCFVCGSLEHKAKQCKKGQDCFICKKGGHRAKDCPEKYKGGFQDSKICLKCGNCGHDMFSCPTSYSADDLKEIQCYICKRFGHLCCVDFSDPRPRELSCYRCGRLGHDGLDCGRSRGESSGTGTGTGSSCYKCGVEGHFARECRSSVKAHKKNRDLATPTKKFSKENRDYVGNRSLPPDIGKTRKRKKNQYEDGGFSTPAVSKKRGGWIPEDLGDSPGRNRWRYPATPTNRKIMFSGSAASGNASSSHFSGQIPMFQFANSASNGSARFYQHTYSAPRFGKFSSEGIGRNYGW